VGYATADIMNPQGSIYVGSAGATPREIEDANGNFAAAFLDEDTLLVNASRGVGSAQNGQGVYAVRGQGNAELLIGELGDNSGFLAVTDDFVLAGGYWATEMTTRIYGFSRAKVLQALAENKRLSASADAELLAQGNFLAAAVWQQALVLAVADANYALTKITRRALTLDGDRVQLSGTETTLATPGDSSTSLANLVSDGARLGVVLVDGAGKKEMALVFAER
jgi:hypothetical protein